MDTNVPDEFGLFNSPEIQNKPVETLPVASVPEGTTNTLALACSQAGVPVDTEQLKILDEFMSRARHGHQSALPMRCKGMSCAFLNHCPLYKAKLDLPVGQACPVERAMIAEWVNETLTALDIDPTKPENAVDLDMAMELAGMELIRWRAACHMADDPKLTEEKIVAYSPQGQPIFDEKPKMSLLILERQARIIGKLREQLLATRKSQAMVGRVASDVSVRAATLQDKARNLLKERSRARNAVDAQFEIRQPKDGEES